MEGNNTMVYIVGAAAIGAVAYYFYTQSQSAAAASATPAVATANTAVTTANTQIQQLQQQLQAAQTQEETASLQAQLQQAQSNVLAAQQQAASAQQNALNQGANAEAYIINAAQVIQGATPSTPNAATPNIVSAQTLTSQAQAYASTSDWTDALASVNGALAQVALALPNLTGANLTAAQQTQSYLNTASSMLSSMLNTQVNPGVYSPQYVTNQQEQALIAASQASSGFTGIGDKFGMKLQGV